MKNTSNPIKKEEKIMVEYFHIFNSLITNYYAF